MGCALRTLPLSCFPPRFHAISRLGNKVTFYTFTGIVWKRSQPHAYNDRNHRNRPWLSYQISDQKYKQYTAHDKQSWSPAKDKRGKNSTAYDVGRRNTTQHWPEYADNNTCVMIDLWSYSGRLMSLESQRKYAFCGMQRLCSIMDPSHTKNA